VQVEFVADAAVLRSGKEEWLFDIGLGILLAQAYSYAGRNLNQACSSFSLL